MRPNGGRAAKGASVTGTTIVGLLENAGGRYGVLTGEQRKAAGELLAVMPNAPLVIEARMALSMRERSRTEYSRINRDHLLRDALRRLAGIEESA